MPKPVVPTKMSRAERLAKMQAKLKNVDLGGGGAGFWSPKEGKSIIRILPEIGKEELSFVMVDPETGKDTEFVVEPHGEMEYFFQPVGKHSFPPDGKKHCYCPKFTSEGQLDCPVCDLTGDLWKGDKASKALAKELGLRKAFWMNIIVRGDDKAGPKIFTPGVKIFTAIQSIISDPDYGDITDLADGLDITVERSGTGFETEYSVTPRRKSSPVSEDPNLILEWMAKAKDLSYVEVSDDPEEDKELAGEHAVWVMPYDRISREMELDGDLMGEDDNTAETTEEDPDEEPVRTPARKAATPAPVARKAKEEVVEDDPEEEVAPAKREVASRLARRSTRR
jgi:hypothetical protein